MSAYYDIIVTWVQSTARAADLAPRSLMRHAHARAHWQAEVVHCKLQCCLPSHGTHEGAVGASSFRIRRSSTPSSVHPITFGLSCLP